MSDAHAAAKTAVEAAAAVVDAAAAKLAAASADNGRISPELPLLWEQGPGHGPRRLRNVAFADVGVGQMSSDALEWHLKHAFTEVLANWKPTSTAADR